MTEKYFHIYAKNQCIYHSLNEEDFTKTWEMIQKFLSVHDANIDKNELEYVEVLFDKNDSSLQGSSY
jgi:TPP-dependent 2-oxoacid decarboxylase